MFTTMKTLVGLAAAAAVFAGSEAVNAQTITGTICNTAGHPWGGCTVKLWRQNSPTVEPSGRVSIPEQTLVATTITDASGRYVFYNPGSGTYAVRAKSPTGTAWTSVVRTMYYGYVYWIDMAVR